MWDEVMLFNEIDRIIDDLFGGILCVIVRRAFP